MKQIVLYLSLTAAALSLSACTTTESPTTTNPGVATAVQSPSVEPSSSTAPVSSFKETAKANPATVIPYPFTSCAVIRKEFDGGSTYRRVYKNHEVIFCCTPCLKTFDANPEPYMPRIIAAAAAKARGETVYSGW